MESKGKYYLTTAIAYTSAKPHIGNNYEIVLADSIARFKRKEGYDVFFQTGTDEHGQKIELKAEAAGITPKEHVDKIAGVIRGLCDLLNISYDKFIRTTDEDHEKQVQKIFKRLYDQGDIYKGAYEGMYCTPCESFWTESQLVDGKCPDCGGVVKPAKEEAYFFRMSKYADKLIKHINEHPEFIQPVSRKNEMMNNFLLPGLQDLCVSRTSFTWGIPVTFDPKQVYDFQLEKTLDEKVLLKQLGKAIDAGQKRSIEVDVSNTDRAFGTILGSEITRKLGDDVEEDTYHVLCKGAGGQSFGAFIPKGLTLELVGDSNDYFGKGLSGGKLVVYPPQGSKFKAEENIIIGNVALYGATSGKAFINGVAGERFCVRNSGAIAVVEGVGDHGCEYMTGGRVVVLGMTGKNFAAGMSGGIAYVLDEGNDLYKRLNKEMVSSSEITSKYDVLELKSMIQEHVALTNSTKGKEVLDNFGEYLPKFKKIIPHDYERVLKTIVQMEEKGLSAEQAQIEAFYANTRK